MNLYEGMNVCIYEQYEQSEKLKHNSNINIKTQQIHTEIYVHSYVMLGIIIFTHPSFTEGQRLPQGPYGPCLALRTSSNF